MGPAMPVPEQSSGCREQQHRVGDGYTRPRSGSAMRATSGRHDYLFPIGFSVFRYGLFFAFYTALPFYL